MTVVDSHHHLWDFDAGEYGWIGEGMGVLQRDFRVGDLVGELDSAGVDGAIGVQARQTMEETRWLLEKASGTERIAGVVGWVPLKEDGVDGILEELSGERKLVGVRHVVQDEVDDEFILGAAFNRGVARLAGFDLAYDILIFERHLPQTVEFVDRHPDQIFVLDHLGKPVVEGVPTEGWKRGLRELAQRENVACKLSGLVTEVQGESWNVGLLQPYVEEVLEAFGAGRVMFGSDWPVCLLRANYGRWVEVVRELVSELSDDEAGAVMGRNAMRVYGIG